MGIAAIAIVAVLIIAVKLYSDVQSRKLLETATSLNRGTYSERDFVLKLLKYGIPAGAIFHDIYIKKHNGNFSQIDLVVPTKVGIITFEIKDYSGWVFGNGRHTNWTKVLAYGREKYRFYNPIMQNNKHISDLKKLIPNEKVPFYSVIVFYGNCELKEISFVPSGTYITNKHRALDVVDEILNRNEEADYTDKRNIMNVLAECVRNGESKEIQNRHIEQIQDMLGKDRIFE